MKLNNLKIYYSLISINNLWFITSSWLFFWLKFMTIQEVGFIDAIAFMIGILFEFPAGIVSDKLNRKSVIVLSQVFQFLGSFVVTLAVNQNEIAIGFIIFQLGTALYFSTIESFGFESSNEFGLDYIKVVNKSTNLSNIFYLISVLIGGYLYTINQNFPNFLFSVSFLIGLLLALQIQNLPKEELITKNFGIRDLNQKFDLKTIFYFIFLLSLSFSFDYGFLKLVLLESFTTVQNNFIYLIVGTFFSILISSWLVTKVKDVHFSLQCVFYLLCFVLLLSFINPHSELLLFYILSFIVIFTNQLFLNYVNVRLDDSTRASAISFLGFIYKFPYVLLSVIYGISIEKLNISAYFLWLGLAFIILRIIVKFGLKLSYNWIFERGRSSVAE